MTKYNKFGPISFIDETGWSQHEDSLTLSPHHYFDFLRQFESVQKKQGRARSKLRTVERQEKMKSSRFFVERKNYEDYRESVAKQSQFPPKCIFQSIDLSNQKPKAKYRWSKQAKQYFKMDPVHAGRAQKPQPHSDRKVSKLPYPLLQVHPIQKNKQQLSKTRVVSVQLNELAGIDPVAKRYLRNYFKEKKQEFFQFPTRQRIFQLPQPHSQFT